MAKVKKYGKGGELDFGPDQDMSDVSPQDVADAKARAKARMAYEAAATTIAPMTKGMAANALNKSAGLPPIRKKDESISGGMPPIGQKAGGSVSSDSKRGDGIATKGKTRGTMIAMCGGGKAKK